MVDNPKGDLVIHVTVACGILETVAVCLRLLARWRTKASFAADDWLIVATLLPSYCMLITGSLMVTLGGAGLHAQTLSPSQLTVNSSLIAYSLTIAMAKISVLLLYRRIFNTPAFRKAVLLIGGSCVAWATAAICCLLFQCHPIADMWNPAMTFTDNCIDLQVYYSAVAGTNMALDIVVLCLPLWMVWALRLDAGQKVVLSGMFALGALTCFASLMRIITVNLTEGSDIPYTIVTPYIWSQIEATMAIICACLITYRPLFSDLDLSSCLDWSRRFSSSSSKHHRKGPWYGSSSGSSNTTDNEGPLRRPSLMGKGGGDRDRDRDLERYEQLNSRAMNGDLYIVNVEVW